MQNPLGKYAPIIAALVAIGVIAAAAFQHVAASGDPFLDNLALLAFGAIFGSAATSNGATAEVKALHKRLDAVDAPGPGMPAGGDA